MKLGADIIHSIYKYQLIIQDLKKELDLTKGWLKPKKLFEVTGRTAQEVLKLEAKEKIKNSKKPSNIDTV